MNSLSLFSKVYRFRLTIRAHGFSPARRLPNLRQCPCRRFFAGSVQIPIRRRQDLTESAGNAFSVVHGALQEQPLGSHEQRALLPDTGSRPRQRRQGAAPPRGAARPVLARIAQADPPRVQERTARASAVSGRSSGIAAHDLISKPSITGRRTGRRRCSCGSASRSWCSRTGNRSRGCIGSETELLSTGQARTSKGPRVARRWRFSLSSHRRQAPA